MQSGRTRYRVVLGRLVVAVLAWSWASSAVADEHIRGLITGRGDGGAVFIQTDSGRLLVALSDATDIQRLDGIRPVKVSSAELIPGLRVRVDGEFETSEKFIAEKVTFTKEDFRTAAASELATERVSSQGDLTAVRSITVYFDNGKFTVSRDQKAQLQQLVRDAHGLSGYMIQVTSYSRAVGSEPNNQRLSMEQASAVTAILRQSGVPLANVIVSAATGISEHTAPNQTSSRQSQNHRAVVTLLQNKATTGQ
jgi:outer membrane protein OmpA-like peptidoglycan-associated protein